MANPQTNPIKGNILIVDDTPANLRLLSAMLTEQGYTVRAVVNGSRALTAARLEPPDLVLLDINMPEMNGYEVCRNLKEDEQTHDIPIIFISAMDEVLDKVRAFSVGGVDYITKPFQVEEVLLRVQNHLTLHRLQLDLERQVQERTAALVQANRELAHAYDSTLEGWVHFLDLRDKETEGHSQRVTEMTLRLARSMGFSDEELVHIRRGALLHDVGKIGIPDAILHKPGKLNDEERHIMNAHPVYAYRILEPIEYLRPALDIPYCHHEKWDGSGYPRGLKGEEIPLAARIFAIVDVWDALTSDRPYRSAWGVDETVTHIRASSGSHFDPQIVEAFLQMIAPEMREHGME